MEKKVSKKTGVILLLVSIVVAVTFTFVILNYIQTPKVAEGPSESGSSGEVSLTIVKPLKVKEESEGSVNLEILSSGG